MAILTVIALLHGVTLLLIALAMREHSQRLDALSARVDRLARKVEREGAK